jgi:hypothetical protein
MSRWKTPLIGILVGGAIGFAWNMYFPCVTGRCPLSHNPQVSMIVSTLFGAIFGYVVTRV